MSRDPLDGLLRGSLALALPPATSEQAALESVLEALAPIFEGTPPAGGERACPLLVSTHDAGTDTAVRFWRDALAVGPALANPRAFPWCLANAPCATIARRFAITGPNITWIASGFDQRAFDAPAAWLAEHLLSAPADGQPAQAWLVALRFGAPAPKVMVWHWAMPAGPNDTERVGAVELAAPLCDRMVRDWAMPA